MTAAAFDLIADFAGDPAHGWSIGSFGAIGEFVRDPGEPAELRRSAAALEIVTARGAMRIVAAELTPIAWDSLSADGESWGHALAFCVPQAATPERVLRDLGPDSLAVRPQDRADRLFDLGVGCGAVSMGLRTGDAALIGLLEQGLGQPFLAQAGLMPEVLRAQPNRVLRSPAGRIEVFQPIPPADGKSPEGPHTHLLPRLIGKHRPHSANVPIPEGWQSALSLHPRSPWRTPLGERHHFRPDIDAAFAPHLARFGLGEDAAVADALLAAIAAGADPATYWPETRRGRNKTRIVLRRLAAAGDERVKPWRAAYDRAPVEIEEGEDA